MGVWIVGFGRRGHGMPARLWSSVGMCASEQMHYLGAPLAHVLQYEVELPEARIRQVAHIDRARRLYRWQWLRA